MEVLEMGDIDLSLSLSLKRYKNQKKLSMSSPISSQLKKHPTTHLVDHRCNNDHDDRVSKVAKKVHLLSSNRFSRTSSTHLMHHHVNKIHDERIFKVTKNVDLSSDERNRRIKRWKTHSNLDEANRGSSIVIVEIDDDQKVSSPNSTVSSVSGKRCDREISDDDDGGGGGGERKKLRLTKEQSAVLDCTFEEHTTLNTKQKVALAKQLSLRPRQVEVWFQNRRARTKLKQTEVDCEYLKRCCEKLTEENRRLQKEVQELRALKLPRSHVNHPATLTVCCSCGPRMVGPSASPSNVLVKAPVGGFRQLMPVKQRHVSTTVQNENLLTL